MLANVEIHLLSGAVRPVADQGKINLAASPVQAAVEYCDIALVDQPFAEQAGQLSMHFLSSRQQEQSGGRHVEPVYGQRIRELSLDSCGQTILLVFAAAWNRKQSGRFVDNDEMAVGKDDVQPGVGWWLVDAHGFRLKPDAAMRVAEGLRFPQPVTAG